MCADGVTQEVVKDDSQVAAVRARLADKIGPQRFGLWFGPQTELAISGDCVTVRAPSAFVRDWLRKNFSDHLRASSLAVIGRELTLEFEVEPALLLESTGPSQSDRADKTESTTPADASGNLQTTATLPYRVLLSDQGSPAAAPSRTRSARLRRSRTDREADAGHAETATHQPPRASGSTEPRAKPADTPRREATLCRFVVGPSNEYACRAAELTAHGRQQASPLLISGPTGVGKTHLLRGILHEYRRRFPRTRAIYLSAEQFTTGFVEALRVSGLPSFRQKSRGADLLIVDDLQFFVGKQRTIEELQHTVDTMLREGRQLVLASDRGLAELRGLGPELTSRLAGGLTCEIGPPEFATRLGILCRLREEMELTIGDDVLSLVAGQITAGARELRGALHRLEAMSFAYQQPISREMAQEALRELTRQTTRAVRLDQVQQVVCDVFGVEPAQLRSERKGRALSEPRMLAMWLARKYTRAAWSEIGQYFGRRSHSTVISAHQRVEKMIAAQADVGLNDRACNVEEAIRKLESALRSA